MGHQQAQGPGEVDALLPVRDPRRLQPLRRRLDRAASRVELAKALIGQACEQQNIPRDQLTVHADRGTSMTSKPVAFLLADLGVLKTHNRPYTSTDNPYSEAQFKTLKYRPGFPRRFDSIEHAKAFCRQSFSCYNDAHRHSGIGLMTPTAVHHGHAEQLHADRARVLAAAYPRPPSASSATRRDHPRYRPPPGSTSPTKSRPLHTNFPTTPSHSA
jgi:putative transposase